MFCLMILGIVGGLGLPFLKQSHQIKQWQVTNAHRERIFYALASFVASKGRLPFPSSPPGKLSFGEENPQCSYGEYMKGFIPFKTLGLAEAFARDGAQNFFIYVVHPQLTFTKTARDYCDKEIHHLLPIPSHRSLSFDPVAVVLISPRKGGEKNFRENCWSHGDMRWETRRNLVAFYGRLFYLPPSP